MGRSIDVLVETLLPVLLGPGEGAGGAVEALEMAEFALLLKGVGTMLDTWVQFLAGKEGAVVATAGEVELDRRYETSRVQKRCYFNLYV